MDHRLIDFVGVVVVDAIPKRLVSDRYSLTDHLTQQCIIYFSTSGKILRRHLRDRAREEMAGQVAVKARL